MIADRLAAWLRNGWRQLTSMRTALVLLFLLALAAIPGSVLPQRGVNPQDVADYYAAHPDLAPVLDRLGGFDVYRSPWFSAIYLLLFVSLVGCVVPRLRDHLASLRSGPPDAPQRLSRLPRYAGELAAPQDPATTAAALRATLRRRRWRAVVRTHPDGSATVSAEKGYLKETGNLLMHAAMVVVLAGVAYGAAYGWHGNRLVVAGPEHGFCNTMQQYDEVSLGTRVDGGDLAPFCFSLTGFDAAFTPTGQALSFLASGEVTEAGGPPRAVEFTVNDPLRLDGASVYLLGHGYAPQLRYTDRAGDSQVVTAPFLPLDPLGTAEGVAAFPDANLDSPEPAQVAFHGLYLPTAPAEGPLARSTHPEERAPVLFLQPYQGDLGLDDGRPQSVWTLDEAQLASGALAPAGTPEFLAPGEQMTLADGTTVEFLGTQRWITVSVRHDPGQPVVLVGAVLLLAGLVLALTGHRRRVWFRARPLGTGSEVAAGGLPRTDYPGFADEFRDLVAAAGLDPVPEPALRST